MLSKMVLSVWMPLALIAVLALTLRLYGIGDKPLWLDEAFSVWFSDQSWSYLWNEVPKFETHPPLYYSLLKIWRTFGSDEGTLRLLSLALNMLTLPVLYRCGTLIGGANGKQIGLLACFYFATSYWQLNFSQDARPYTMFMFFYAAALLCSLWIVKTPEKSLIPFYQSKYGLVWFALGASLGLLQWSHNLGVLYIFAIGAFLSVWWIFWQKAKPSIFINLAFTVVIAVIVYAPFLPAFLGQFGTVHGNFWITEPTFEDLYRYTVRIYGPYFELPYSTYAKIVHTFAVAPLALAGLLYLWKAATSSPEKHGTLILLMAAAFLPWILCVVLTFLVQPVFLMRLLMPMQLPWLLILACGPFLFYGRTRTLLIVMQAVIFLYSAWIFHQNPDINGSHGERVFKEALIEIAQKTDKDTPVLTLPNDTALMLDYYKQRLNLDVRLLPQPSPYPSGGEGVGTITPESIEKMNEEIEGSDTVWLIARGRLSTPNYKDPDFLLINSLKKQYREEIISDGALSIRVYRKQ